MRYRGALADERAEVMTVVMAVLLFYAVVAIGSDLLLRSVAWGVSGRTHGRAEPASSWWGSSGDATAGALVDTAPAPPEQRRETMREGITGLGLSGRGLVLPLVVVATW